MANDSLKPSGTAATPNPFAVTQGFLGMNTLAPREAIEDGRHVWLENKMPIGTALLPVPAPESPVLNTSSIASGGSTITRLFVQDVNGTDYLMVVTSGGALWTFNLTTGSLTPTQRNGAVTLSSPDMSQWKSERVLIADPIAGFYSWNGTDNLGVGGSVQVDATLYTYVASYAGRVWLGNVAGGTGQRTYVATAPNTYNDFATADGAVAAIVTEEDLRSQILQLTANSDYLYIFGDSGVYYIANVQANGTHVRLPVTTTGGVLAYSCATAFDKRSVMYLSGDGIHLLSALQQQVMDPQIAPTHSQLSAVQGANATLAHINGILCSVFRAQYADPMVGARNVYVCVNSQNQEVFVASQGNEIWTTSYESKGVWYTYATDGQNIYRLFQNTTALISQQAKSKYYDFTGNPVQAKRAVKAGAIVSLQASTGTLQMVLETEIGPSNTMNILQANLLPTLTWTTGNGGVLTFTTNNGGAITWFIGGLAKPAADPELTGFSFCGYDITGTNPGNSISAVVVEYQPGDFWMD